MRFSCKRSRLGGVALAAVLCSRLACAAQPAPLVLSSDENPDGWNSRFATMVYAEVSKRMGIPIRIVNFPTVRNNALQDSGEIDGDAGRVFQYADAHPNLIRIEEPFIEMRFALFAVKPNLGLKSVEELRGRSLLVDYRRGILICERALKPVVAANRLNDLSNEAQGAKKLLAGRTDLYCDLETPFKVALAAPELKADAPRVYKALDLGALKLYPYLHKKNAALAPRLAAVIKQMKAEGVIDAYHAQLDKEFGFK